MRAGSSMRNVAIIASNRIPFCRSNTAYSDLSNLDMLSTVLQGLSDRCALSGKLIDEVVAGAVISHAKDFNLAREAVLSTDLSPMTPGITLQQACGTSLQAAFGIAAKIATGQIECGIAAGSDTASDAPVVFSRSFAQRLVRASSAKTMQQRLAAFRGIRLRELAPVAPAILETRTGLSMGQHCELMAQEWGIGRAEQDELALQSHHKAQSAYERGFFDTLVQPCEGVLRDNNLRSNLTPDQLAKLKPAFDKGGPGTLTAGNSTALTDGAAAVLLASEDWAAANGLPVLARLTDFQTSAVDYVGGEGLLIAPVIAVGKLLKRTSIALQDFSHYEIHEAFAAQVLVTLKAWASEDYCRDRIGLDTALGEIDRDKLNQVGSSLAVGHPFAATGARVLGTLAQQLAEAETGRGLISVCTAAGMGLAAIIER